MNKQKRILVAIIAIIGSTVFGVLFYKWLGI